jgi:hypothetical protein
METQELDMQMRNYKCYIGTYARDMLPSYKIFKRPVALIMNTDVGSDPGQHWVALFIDEYNRAEFFDSFGYTPFYPEVLKFLSNNKVNIIQYNAHELQSAVTSTCGAYCVLYLKMRCNDLDFCSFIKLFSKNKLANDLIVTRMLN